MACFKPAGIIGTIMRWNKPAWWIFNLALFAWQFVMLGAAKLIGYILQVIYYLWGNWNLESSLGRLATKFNVFRVITWRQIWQAAQWCHVRMLLNPIPGDSWRCISFTAPIAKFDYWSPGTVDQSRGHFVYLEPAFEITPVETINLQEKAESMVNKELVARKYDYLQLFSFCVNSLLWLFWWPCWGRQVITWFNLPGGREVCSTGVAMLLIECVYALSGLFLPFAVAMVCPALFVVSKNWRRG
jgi:hypothetical protein